MKQEKPRRPRAALMLSVAALLATPALAQEVAAPPVAADTGVTPPPVVRTLPQGGAPSGDSATPINPEAAAQAAAEDAERRAARPAARTVARARSAAAPTRAAAAPRTEAPAPATVAPAAAPIAQTPPPRAATPVAPVAEKSAGDQPQTTTDTTKTTTQQGPAMWPLALIALLIVAAGAAFFVMRRRKPTTDEIYEPVHAEPVAVAQPAMVRAAPVHAAPVAAAAAAGVMVDDRLNDRQPANIVASPDTTPETTIVTDAAPVAADEASIADANDADVAALTAAHTKGDRPWLEFAMRPVRAGANVDEALVEIELTVANAGNMAAEDVRITTFMLPASNDSEMDRLLTERHDESVTPLTIAAGEGTRVDATLATSRADLVNGAESAAFQPVIVADARYRLPDGSEGRTSASFLIGGTPEEGTTLEPLSLDRPVLREDVEARLYREPARV